MYAEDAEGRRATPAPPHRAAISTSSPLIVAAAVALLLAYVLPLFVPPPATPVIRPDATMSLWTRLFPDVPGWWIAARLAVLLIAAILVARAAPAAPFSLRRTATPSDRWRYPWIPAAALAAALMQALWLPWRAALPPLGQTAFMLWFALPGALLAWGRRPEQPSRRPIPGIAWAVGATLAVWIAFRIVVAWHSPRAADVVDTWRPFGGFAHLATTNGNFLVESMDPDLPGLSAMLLFFQGLPLVQLGVHAPDLTWMQVANAGWIAVCAALMAALTAAIVGRGAALVAAVAFVFSPFMLLFQLCPTPSALFFFPVVMALLIMKIFRDASASALALLGSAIGIAAGMPMLLPVLAFIGPLILVRLWQRPRFPPLIVATAVASLAVGLAASLPTPTTVVQMYARYVATQIPLAVAEPAVHGQISPTIEDWFGGPLPEGVPITQLQLPVTRGWLMVPLGALLSPVAIPRWSLRLWGDSMWEPLSAGLLAIGVAVALRYARRDRVTLVVLLGFAVSLLPGFSSSYDRASLIRLLAAPVPVTLFAAAGFHSVVSLLPSAAARRWATLTCAAAIALSGTVLFDLVNPRILAASSLGMLARSVGDGDLDRAALLTSFARDTRPDVPPGRRYWDLDWLRHNHPYISEIVRSVPKRPIPIVDLDRLALPESERGERDVVFWTPALEQTAAVTDRLCATWPEATLYTITDVTGMSRLHAARLSGAPWQPADRRERWSETTCAARSTAAVRQPRIA